MLQTHSFDKDDEATTRLENGIAARRTHHHAHVEQVVVDACYGPLVAAVGVFIAYTSNDIRLVIWLIVLPRQVGEPLMQRAVRHCVLVVGNPIAVLYFCGRPLSKSCIANSRGAKVK
jgi:hypothetical protein